MATVWANCRIVSGDLMLPPGLSLLPMNAVSERTGLSPDSIRERIGRGVFPSSKKLGPDHIVWRSDEIDEWIEAELERADCL